MGIFEKNFSRETKDQKVEITFSINAYATIGVNIEKGELPDSLADSKAEDFEGKKVKF